MDLEAPSYQPVDRTALHAALDAVIDADVDGGGEALAGAVAGAHLLRTAVDGSMVGVIAGFEASMAWAVDGHRSPVGWQVARHRALRAAVSAERRCALDAHRMPHVAAAASAGLLGQAQLRALVRARRAPVEHIFDRDQAQLVGWALELDADALRRRLERWYYDALAEIGANEPDRDPGGTDRNTARISPGYGGRGLLDADLDPEAHVTVAAAIDAEIDRWRRDGDLDADTRTYAELRGDALVALIARGAAHPAALPARPLVVAVVDVDTLLRRGDLPAADRMARRAEILGAGPVSDATIRELATRAGIALLVTERGGHPLWLGRTTRLASGAQRTAVLAADPEGGRCYWPGCHAPAHRCQVDHLTGWQQGGSTDITNLGLICPHHNRLKHRQRYRAARAPDGTIVVTRSDGTPVAPPTEDAA